MSFLAKIAIISLVFFGNEIIVAGEWKGFHGLDKYGTIAEGSLPLHWDAANRAAWKVEVPGAGHSSPIIINDSVFVTSAYPTIRHQNLERYFILANQGMAALLGLLLIGKAGRCSFRGLVKTADWKSPLVSLTQLAAGLAVLGVVFFGDTTLSLEDNPVRKWKATSLTLLACLALAGMQFLGRARIIHSENIPAKAFGEDGSNASGVRPGKSLGFSIAMLAGLSMLSLGIACLLYSTLPEKEQLFQFDSFSSLTTNLTLAAPFGFILLASVLYFLALKSRCENSEFSNADRRKNPAVKATGIFASWERKFWPNAAFILICLFTGGLYFCEGNYFAQKQEMTRALICYDLKTGERRWVCEGLTGPQTPVYRKNSPATPTPATDGKRVYSYFGTAGLMGTDMKGNLLWENRDLISEQRFNAVSSPVCRNGVVVVLSDVGILESEGRQEHSYIVGIDAKSGKEKWRQIRKSHDLHGNYSTPVIEPINGKDIVLALGWDGVAGYDLMTGTVRARYEFDYQGNHLVASPVANGNILFCPGAREHLCLDLPKLASGADPLIWSVKSRGEIASSPVIVNGLIFLITETGTASCLDLQSGKELWLKRLRGKFFASAIADGGTVCFPNESGVLYVLERAAEFKLLKQREFEEEIFACFACARNRLVARTTSHLYCFEPA